MTESGTSQLPADARPADVDLVCPACGEPYRDQRSFIHEFWAATDTFFHCWCHACKFQSDLRKVDAGESGDPATDEDVRITVCPRCATPVDDGGKVQKGTDGEEVRYLVTCGGCGDTWEVTPIVRVLAHEAE